MAFKALTIDTIATADPHIYAYDQAVMNQSLVGNGDYVFTLLENLGHTIVSANRVDLKPGVLSIKGHYAYIESGTTVPCTIDNGVSGVYRNDLICAKFVRSSGIDTMSIIVLKGTPTSGTPTDPTYTADNPSTGNWVRHFPLKRVSLNGLSISSVTDMFTLVPSIQSIYSDLTATTDANGYVQQKTGNIKTITRNIPYQLWNFTYSSQSGTWNSLQSVTLPPSFSISSVKELSVEVVRPDIYMVSPVGFNVSTNVLQYNVYSFTNVAAQSGGIMFKVSGI